MLLGVWAWLVGRSVRLFHFRLGSGLAAGGQTAVAGGGPVAPVNSCSNACCQGQA